jgi:hypothetical protein
MKPRARRVTIAVAALGVGVVGLLVVVHWGAVRDQYKAWCVQLAKYTETIQPKRALTGHPIDLRRDARGDSIDLDVLLECLANSSGLPVIYVPLQDETVIGANDRYGNTLAFSYGIAGRLEKMTAASARAFLEENGWRVFEQRFPRRAYVVIRKEAMTWQPDDISLEGIPEAPTEAAPAEPAEGRQR